MKTNLLKADGSTEQIQVRTFKDIQKFVGGYVQLFKNPLSSTWLCLNEDGLALQLPKNQHFSSEYIFVGDIVEIQDPKELDSIPYE